LLAEAKEVFTSASRRIRLALFRKIRPSLLSRLVTLTSAGLLDVLWCLYRANSFEVIPEAIQNTT
jgi:hypothetical protein